MNDLQNLDLTPLNRKQKAKLIIEYCKKHRIESYVETGAGQGETIRDIVISRATKTSSVKNIYAIERDMECCSRLWREYDRYENLKVYQGDAAVQIKRLLEGDGPVIRLKTLFYLDAYEYSRADARKKISCPALKQIEAINIHELKKHVIIMDNADLFCQKSAVARHKKNWPTFDEVTAKIRLINKKYKIEIVKNMIIAEIC